MNDKPLPCHLDPDYLYDAKVEAKLERDAMTPQQQAQEWVRNNTSWVDTVPSDLAGIPHTETWLCEANDCKRAFLAGRAAGVEAEKQRIWAEISRYKTIMKLPLSRLEIEAIGVKLVHRIIFGEDK